MIYDYESKILQWFHSCFPEIRQLTYASDEDLLSGMAKFKFFPTCYYSRSKFNIEWDHPIVPNLSQNDNTSSDAYYFEFYPVQMEYVSTILVENQRTAFEHIRKLRRYLDYNPYVYVKVPGVFGLTGDETKVQIQVLDITSEDIRLANDQVGACRAVRFRWKSTLVLSYPDDNSLVDSKAKLVEAIHIQPEFNYFVAGSGKIYKDSPFDEKVLVSEDSDIRVAHLILDAPTPDCEGGGYKVLRTEVEEGVWAESESVNFDIVYNLPTGWSDRFLGWYDGETLVSSEPSFTYTFQWGDYAQGTQLKVLEAKLQSYTCNITITQPTAGGTIHVGNNTSTFTADLGDSFLVHFDNDFAYSFKGWAGEFWQFGQVFSYTVTGDASFAVAPLSVHTTDLTIKCKDAGIFQVSLDNTNWHDVVVGGYIFFDLPVGNYQLHARVKPGVVTEKEFAGWSGGSTSNPLNLLLTDPISLEILDNDKTYLIQFTATQGKYLVNGNECERYFGTKDEVVSIQFVPNTEYDFVQWEDGSTVNPRSYTISGAATLAATVSVIIHNYHIALSSNIPDSVFLVDGALWDPTDTFISTEPHTITAEAPQGSPYVFDHWSDGSTSNPYVGFYIDSDYKALGAVFTAPKHSFQFGNPSQGSCVYYLDGVVLAVGTIIELEEGSEHLIECVPGDGWDFLKWSDDVYDNPRTIAIPNHDCSYSAVLSVINYTVNATTEHGSITAKVNGTVRTLPLSGLVYGDVVELTVVPDSTWFFRSWSDGSTANPYTFSVTGNKTLTTNMEQGFTITTDVSKDCRDNLPHGTITLTPSQATYQPNSVVNVACAVESGYKISYIKVNGNFVSNSSFTLVMNQSYTIYLKVVSLTTMPITFLSTEGGSLVASWDSNVVYSGAYVPLGEVINLTPTPITGYVFSSYIDPDSVITDNVWKIIEHEEEGVGQGYVSPIVAQFSNNVVRVSFSNIQGGIATGDGLYSKGATVAVDFTVTSGWLFEGWVSGGQVVCATTHYEFAPQVDTVLTVQTFNTNVYISGVSIDNLCQVTGSGYYKDGDEVTLSVISSDRYEFDHWYDDPSGGEPYPNPRTFTINKAYVESHPAPIVYTAVCKEKVVGPHLIGITGGTGSITYRDSVIALPTTAETNFKTQFDSNFTVATSANPHYHFSGWSDGVSTPNREFRNVTSVINVSATYAVDQHRVTPLLGGEVPSSGRGTLTLTNVTKGTTSSTSIQWDYGDTIKATYTGGNYLVSGRSITQGGVTSPYTEGSEFTLTADTVITYTLIYDYITITPGVSEHCSIKLDGVYFTSPASIIKGSVHQFSVVKDGYTTFDGWYVNGSLYSGNEEESISFTENSTILAKAVYIDYYLTVRLIDTVSGALSEAFGLYDSDEYLRLSTGVWKYRTPANVTESFDTEIVFTSNPAIFDGWYMDGRLICDDPEGLVISNPTSNLTVEYRAHYDKPTYSYDAYGEISADRDAFEFLSWNPTPSTRDLQFGDSLGLNFRIKDDGHELYTPSGWTTPIRVTNGSVVTYLSYTSINNMFITGNQTLTWIAGQSKEFKFEVALRRKTYTFTAQDDGHLTITHTATARYLETVTFEAEPEQGYNFGYWEDQSSLVQIQQNPYSFPATVNRTIKGYSSHTPYNISVTAVHGTASTDKPSGEYFHNDDCTITCTPEQGYHFVRWEYSDGTTFSTDNPDTFVVRSSLTLRAICEINTYEVSISSEAFTLAGGVDDSRYAQVSSMQITDGNNVYPAVWDSTNHKYYVKHAFTYGTAITISAVPAVGFELTSNDGWYDGSVRVSSQTSYSYTVGANKDFVFKDSHETWNLTITVDEGYDIDESSCVEVYNPYTGEFTFPEFTSSTLVVAYPSLYIVNFDGCALDSHHDLSISGGYVSHLLEDNEIMASFSGIQGVAENFVQGDVTFLAHSAIRTFTVQVNVPVGGSAGYTLTPNYGDTVSIETTVSPHFVFDHWDYTTGSGEQGTWSDNPHSLANVTDDYVIQGYINVEQVTLQSVTVPHATVACKVGGQAIQLPYTADYNTAVVITVTPDTGYSFTGWTDGGSDNPRTYNMVATGSLTGTTSVIQCPLNIYYGLIKPSSSAIIEEQHCSVPHQDQYDYGTTVTLTCTPDSDAYSFRKWQVGTMVGGVISWVDDTEHTSASFSFVITSTVYYRAVVYQEHMALTITADQYTTFEVYVNGTQRTFTGKTVSLSVDKNDVYCIICDEDGSVGRYTGLYSVNGSTRSLVTTQYQWSDVISDSITYNLIGVQGSGDFDVKCSNGAVAAEVWNGTAWEACTLPIQNCPFGTQFRLTATPDTSVDTGTVFSYWEDGSATNPRVYTFAPFERWRTSYVLKAVCTPTYFWLEPLDVGTTMTVGTNGTYEYSTDLVTWTEVTGGDIVSSSRVYLRASSPLLGLWTPMDAGSSVPVRVGGNLLSLNGSAQTVPVFTGLFSTTATGLAANFQDVGELVLPDLTGSTGEEFKKFLMDTNVVDASFVVRTVSPGCCSNMFNGCSSLVTPPYLSASVTVSSCYDSMFNKCTSSSFVPPELPATTLVEYCYHSMFSGCVFRTAPAIRARSIGTGSLQSMFASMLTNSDPSTEGVSVRLFHITTCTGTNSMQSLLASSSVTEAPHFVVMTLAGYDLSYAFQQSKVLSAPHCLPALTPVDSCYFGMFYRTTVLTVAPILAARSLSLSSAYQRFLSSCQSVIKLVCHLSDDTSWGRASSIITNLPSGHSAELWVYSNVTLPWDPLPTGWFRYDIPTE